MKILYASGLPLPVQNILDGKAEIEGFPAYYWPMYKLIKRGHDVKFIFWSNYIDEGKEIKVDWFSRTQIAANIHGEYIEKKNMSRISRDIKRLWLFYKAIVDEVKSGEYDVIYGHGKLGAIAQLVGKKYKVPVCIRWYGDSDFCCKTIEKKGKYFAALKHPMNWLNYRLPYAYFLTTDDHSFGDITYNAWHKSQPSGPFYHWKTGIEFKDIKNCVTATSVPEHDYIFYAGRFARWKGIENVIETLNHLHKSGRNLHLYLAGQTEGGASSLEYIDSLKKQISECGLDGYVHFTGGVSQDTLRVLAYNAVATVIMHHIANIGNVFYEVMTVGSVIVTTDDGSVRQFIDNGVNGFVVEGPAEGAEQILHLLDNHEKAMEMRTSAVDYARKKFLSLDDRFDIEADMIEHAQLFYKDKAAYIKFIKELEREIAKDGKLAAGIWD